MKLHGNAALTLKKRQLLVSRVIDDGCSLVKAAEAAEVSERRAGEWVRRFRAEGRAGLFDRSSAPKHVHNRTPEERIQVIAALRRLRMTGAEIAEALRMPPTTVSGILTRIGMGRLGRLGLEPVERYERKRPGELVHVDVKKLGRIQGGAGWRVRGREHRHCNRTFTDRAGHRRKTVGWEYVHVAVDDATRLAYVRTRPYRPQTNGKAERFIRTLLSGWAYGAIYGSSAERRAALDGWLWRYNHERPHGSLGRKPPAARLIELNNLLGSYT